jgi:hypothetical protein
MNTLNSEQWTLKKMDNKNKWTLNFKCLIWMNWVKNIQQKVKIFNSTKCNAKMTTIKTYLCIMQLLLCKTLEPCSMKWIEPMKVVSHESKGQQEQMTTKL